MNRLLFLIVVISFVSCGRKTPEKKDYYPISGYISGQLSHLDSMPLGIIRYRTVNKVTDTTIVDKATFRATVGKDLIDSDISSEEKLKDYEETNLLDASLGTMSLIYTTHNPTVPVRKIDVLLAVANSEVRTIYVEKLIGAGDSSIMRKILWYNNRSCQVTEIKNKDGAEEVIQDNYVWDTL